MHDAKSELEGVIDSIWFREYANGVLKQELLHECERAVASLSSGALHMLEAYRKSVLKLVALENQAANGLSDTGRSAPGRNDIAARSLGSFLGLLVLTEHFIDEELLLPPSIREQDMALAAEALHVTLSELELVAVSRLWPRVKAARSRTD